MSATSLARMLPFAVWALFLALAPTVFGDGTLHLYAEVFIVLIISSMWNFLIGYAGVVSLGHQAFFGIGGYVVVMFSNQFGVHPFWGLPLAAVVGALVAAIVAPFLFRLRDAYFAFGSWVLAEIIAITFQKIDALGGITGVSLKTIALLDFVAFETHLFWFAGAVALLSVFGLHWLLNTRLGLSWMSVRDNENAAAAIGVDVWRNRFIAFVISGAGVGLAGGISLLGGLAVQPGNAFSADWTVVMSFVVVVGGMGTLEGPIVGTLVYFLLRQVLTVYIPLTGTWFLVALGVVAVLTMLYAPQGLWPLFRDWTGLRWLSIERKFPKLHSLHHGKADK